VVGYGRLIGLNADLHVVEARGAQQLGAAGRQAEPAGDEVRVQAQSARAAHDLDEVAT
jgi:hypothetical protein